MLLKGNEAITALRGYFKKQKLAPLKDLSIVLGTQSRMSIFRRLSKLNYLSSYTHSGAYYTLPEAIQFDSGGLWIYEGVGFSQHGNLKQTITHLVECSDKGKTQSELQSHLKIRVHNTLLALYRKHIIDRKRVNGKNVYISVNSSRSIEQLSQRDAGVSSHSLLKLANWLIIDVLVAIIQCHKLEIKSEDILKKLENKNHDITLAQVESIIIQLDLKKTLIF